METPLTTTKTTDLTRITLAVIFMLGLILATFMVMRPFLSPLIWAAMIVIATWPFFLKLQARLWGKRWLAVLVMTAIQLLVLIVPILFAVLTIVDNADDVVTWCKSFTPDSIKIPPAPEWLEKLPMIGHWASEQWAKIAAFNQEELAKLSKSAAPYATKVMSWFVAQAGNFGLLLLHFLLSVGIAAILYFHGETAAAGIRAFARRLAGQQGEDAAVLSAKAVRGVALGIVVTALAQSTLGGLGLLCSGVPATMLLTAVMFLCCIMQIGPGVILVPAAIWLFWTGHTVTGVIFSVWAVFVTTIDNFLRPYLIKKGADLPLLLILAGVLGGLIAFGIIGLFIGPVVLAVAFTLVRAWVNEGKAAAPDGGEKSAGK